MEHPLIHDRGRGPELVGTRITIYNLVPFFLKPVWTEAAIAEANRVTTEQVAAMRAYFLEHYVDVMAEHERQEEWFRRGVEEQHRRFPPTPYDLEHFQAWVRKRIAEAESGGEPLSDSPKDRLDEFRALRKEWMARNGQRPEVLCRD